MTRYVHEHGILHETYQEYQAKNDPHGKQKDTLNNYITLGVCSAQTDFVLFWVAEWVLVHDADILKKEIYAARDHQLLH